MTSHIKTDVKMEQDSLSQHSFSSSASRARLNAALARKSFVEKEVRLQRMKAELDEQKACTIAKVVKRQAELDAEIQLITSQRLVAEAEAENLAYQQDGSYLGEIEQIKTNKSMVQDYVNRLPTTFIKQEQDSQFTEKELLRDVQDSQDRGLQIRDQETQCFHEQPEINTEKSSFRNPYEELGNYLAKKDLLMTRFSKFLDNPVQYESWKNSFKSIIKELKISCPEEIDLLIHWLGPESSTQAKSLKASHCYNSEVCLLKIWQRLDERYGAPELISSILQQKIINFQKIGPKENKKMYELLDIITEIESVKGNPRYRALFAHYDSSLGINPIILKLPTHLQYKWADKARHYKTSQNVAYPPYSYFVQFIREACSFMNDPSFQFVKQEEGKTTRSSFVSSKKTGVNQSEVLECPLHKSRSHHLTNCRNFVKMSLEERRKCLKENNMCFKCCITDKHNSRNCNIPVECKDCGSKGHSTLMHYPKNNGQGSAHMNQGSNDVNCKCAQMCGNSTLSKSCAKIVKVYIYHEDSPGVKRKAYVLIDEQSNKSLGSAQFFDGFKDVCTYGDISYTLSSCGGNKAMSGRTGKGFMIQGIDRKVVHKLPVLTECNEIPSNREEIPTPEVASKYSHLKGIANKIPHLDETPIMLLLGRDIPIVHHITEQIVGEIGPYAHKLSLGWVIIGETCINKIHIPNDTISVKKTFVHKSGRQSIFPPCENEYCLKETVYPCDEIGSCIFSRHSDDDKLGLSQEDRRFLEIMESEMRKDHTGNWVSPLPFKAGSRDLPNNRELAYKRAQYLHANLQKNSLKREHFITFMQKVLDSGAAEVASPTKDKVWYLPIFGVYHPRKPGKIRGVFDSSALYKGTSLNSRLLQGPNLTNNLLGILLRFRKDECAILGDIEQMFYSFLVTNEDRDYLRFFWYKDNDPSAQLIEYRMCAHVFGNSPSPAIASYGLRKTVEGADDDVQVFVNRDFYVDDGLTSLPSPEKAVSLMKRTQSVLKKANLRLHKIASNSSVVMNKFPKGDLQSDLMALNFQQDLLPVNQTLGMLWNLNTDSFGFEVNLQAKPSTRRGILSTIHSIFDPIGFVSPVMVSGKMIMREITSGKDWDDPLDEDQTQRWLNWLKCLAMLKDVTVPRTILQGSMSTANDLSLYIFSDASQNAVSAVSYAYNQKSTGFVMGKCKLAPLHGHTIPRLELCAALLAAEIGQNIKEEMGVDFKSVNYFTDSRVVLGYIHNTTRRFHNYVSNRVQRILSLSNAHQWNYINTKKNPADIGSRGCTMIEHLNTWLTGPDLLKLSCENTDRGRFPLVAPEDDQEIRKDVVVHKTEVGSLLNGRFEKFSTWTSLIRAFATLKLQVRKFKGQLDSQIGLTETYKDSKLFLLKSHQGKYFHEELTCLSQGKPVHKGSFISGLNPYVDNQGLLRVGGRLRQSSLPVDFTNPVILSSKGHVTNLLVAHYHSKNHHQGRLLTESFVRDQGYWVIGMKRLVLKLIHGCFHCRKLRGKTQHQIMAELPYDRLKPGPPFTYVGVDVFGPWNVLTRKTRGGAAHSKRWAVLFTCLVIRAVHIEVVEEMSTSSFINALRRFIALRGNVREIRSDRGTNFVGAADELKLNTINVEDGKLSHYLCESGITWKFNAPHSSHMGGVWERIIGLSRRILDSMLSGSNGKNLTHEVLVTFMAEVCSILNSRPIAPISSDAEIPEMLCPAILLNQKFKSDFSEISACIDIDPREMYRKHWKMVQVLADTFWKQWQNTYLQSLQSRRKWKTEEKCVKTGDIVLLKDKNLPRNEWSVGIIENTIPSESDKLVRKVEVRIWRNDKCSTYTRPISEIIPLLE